MEFLEEKEHFINGKFSRAPLFFYVAAYLSGILTGAKIEIALFPLCLFILLLLCFSLFIYYYTYHHSGRRRNTTPLKLLLLLILYCAAIINISISGYKTRIAENSVLKDGIGRNINVVLTDNIHNHPNSYSLNCFSTEYGEGLIVYTDQKPELMVGDTLIIINYKGREVKDFETFGTKDASNVKSRSSVKNNSSGFSYKRYLEKRGIYTTAFVPASNIVPIKTTHRSFTSSIKNKREEYIKEIEKSIGSQDGLGVLVALATGDKRYMDSEDKGSYAASGTMHLMAVSGMHVVFIFAMISALLSFLGNSLTARIARATITVITVVIFCAVADFAPSVLRAAITIFLVLISSVINKKSYSLNSLSASALIITIFDPEALFDPGFQLSFAAVLSIIFINPIIEAKYTPKNRVTRYIWQNISISASCQLGVSLISIPMFGYLPLYFLLANTLLIPLSMIIIYAISITILFISFELEIKLLFSVLKFLLKAMNYIAITVGELPLSVIVLDIGRISLFILMILLMVIFGEFRFDHKTKRVVIILFILAFIISLMI
jgi:ComEC/Rec2-related protein